MFNQQQWDVAVTQLDALRRNLPGLMDEGRVREYHAIVQRLQAISGDGNIAAFMIPQSEINPRVASFTPPGRRHPGRISYTEKKYCNNNFLVRQIDALWNYIQRHQRVAEQNMTRVKELSKEILRDLLADFVDRRLTSDALSEGYVGVAIAALKQRCCIGDIGSPVDFDLALKDLEGSDLVDSGPKAPYQNPPGSPVVFVGLFSKHEYVYLTETGYKTAQKIQTTKGAESERPYVHISGGHFHQSPIGFGDHLTQSVAVTLRVSPVFSELRKAIEENGLDSENRAKLFAGIEAMEKAHNSPSFVDRYKEFIALAANHMTIIGPIMPALAALLGSK